MTSVPSRPDRGASPGGACASTELAPLWHLGDMSDAESRRFEAHMDACAACRAEVSALELAAAELALSGPEAEPPPELLGRLLERVRAEPRATAAPGPTDVERGSVMPWNVWPDDEVAGEPKFTWNAEGAWEATPIPGIEARRLFVDRARDRVTMLVRMAPGTAFPPHRHAGPEECLVLEGDLTVGDDTMAKGDFQYAPPGSSHPAQSTKGGCVLLLTSSLADERH